MNQAEKRKTFLGGNVLFLVLVLVNISLSVIISIANIDVGITGSLLLSQGGILIPVILYLIVTKKNPISFLRIKGFHIGSVFLVPILGFCIMPTVTVLNAITMFLFSNTISSSVNGIAASYSYIWGLLLIAVTPAVVEEITCRGVLLNVYKEKSVMWGILMSAVLFGLLHMNFNQLSYAIFMGLVMGILLEITDSIFSTMIMHLVINGTSVTAAYLLPKLYELLEQMMMEAGYEETQASYDAAMEAANSIDFTTLISVLVVYVPIAIAGLTLAGLLFVAIAKLNKRYDVLQDIFKVFQKKPKNIEKTETSLETESVEKEGTKEKVKIVDGCLIVAIVICLLMCIFTEVSSYFM